MINARNKVITLIFVFILSVQFCAAEQEFERANLLKQQIKESKTTKNLDSIFEELLHIYSQHSGLDTLEKNSLTGLNEFYNFLETLERNKTFRETPLIYYYKALTRFKQMQFLEENKMWQELFDKKDLYTADLDKSLILAEKFSKSIDHLTLKLKFLDWRVIKDNERVAIVALEDLFNLATQYLDTEGNIEVIKDIADELSKEDEINYSKKLYSIYVSKLSKMDLSNEKLKEIADSLLKQDKVELAVSLYNVYLDKLSEIPKDRNAIIKEMFDIVERFAHSGWQEGLDPFFAEEVYKRIESLFKIEAFDALSQYRRAYNLERLKEYKTCFGEYLKLVNNFPKYQDKDRIYFRLAILSAYIFNKIDQAKEYFLKVVNPAPLENSSLMGPVRNNISNGVNDYPQSQDYLNSLYHLGLLNHWYGNFEKAGEFYKVILDKTKDIGIKPEIVNLAESRIKEIEQGKEIEYNLRMFLEAALNNHRQEPYLKLELFARAAKDYLDEPIKFETNSYFTNTGCLQQDFTYLWSGQLGNNQNPLNKYEFETSYEDLGTKVVNVVLVGPSGVIGETIEMADIYNKERKE